MRGPIRPPAPKPEPIVIEHVNDNEDGTEDVLVELWQPVKQWTYDLYVGLTRAHELGYWKSSDDPERTWSVPQTITVYRNPYMNYRIHVNMDKKTWIIESDRDMWGTWYHLSAEALSMGMEDGMRSFWQAFIAAMQYMLDQEGNGAFEPMDPPTVEEWEYLDNLENEWYTRNIETKERVE